MKRQYIINVLKKLHCTDDDIQRLIGEDEEKDKFVLLH